MATAAAAKRRTDRPQVRQGSAQGVCRARRAAGRREEGALRRHPRRLCRGQGQRLRRQDRCASWCGCASRTSTSARSRRPSSRPTCTRSGCCDRFTSSRPARGGGCRKRSLQNKIRRRKAAQLFLDPGLRWQAARAAGHDLPERVLLRLPAQPRPVVRQAAARIGDAAVMAAAEPAVADVPERQHVAIKLLDRGERRLALRILVGAGEGPERRARFFRGICLLPV